jgi:hypothetical protein
MRKICTPSRGALDASESNPARLMYALHGRRYIEFFLDCIGTRENISLLYYLAMKLKTVRDGESQEYSEVSTSRSALHNM